MEPTSSTSTAPAEKSLNFITSRQGKPNIVFDNKQYRKSKEYKGGGTLWRCSIKTCHGCLTLNSREEVIKVTEHSCPFDSSKLLIKQVMDDLNKKVISSNEPIPTLYKSKVDEVLDKGLDMVVNIPDFNEIKTGLYNRRNRSHGVKRLFPKTPKDVQIPKEFQDFLLADFNDGKSRILLFATKRSREELGRTRHLYCDGTFKCAPKPFRQIYSIHGEIDGIVKPLAYALLVDKKKSTYKKLFQLLNTTIPDLHVEVFTSNFEEAAVRGIISVFPDVAVKGCYFHYRQALKRKSKALELNKDGIYRKHVALCAALPHLPVEDLEDAWLYIMSECPQDDTVTKFNDYMVTQWINHELWSDKFSTYGEIHKTNNHVESHYAELGKIMNKNKLINLVKLLGLY